MLAKISEYIRFYIEVTRQKPRVTVRYMLKDPNWIFNLIDAYRSIKFPCSYPELLAVLNHIQFMNKKKLNVILILIQPVFFTVIYGFTRIILLFAPNAQISYSEVVIWGLSGSIILYFLAVSWSGIENWFLIYRYLLFKNRNECANVTVLVRRVLGLSFIPIIASMKSLLDLYINISISSIFLLMIVTVLITAIFTSIVNMIIVNLIRRKLEEIDRCRQ